MSQVYPYRLADFLHEQVGDGLRSVIYHDPDGYEVVYVRENVDGRSEEDIDGIVADLWADSYEQGIREELRGYGPLNCTVWVFEEAIEMHFVADERQGIAVALDTETFLAQSTFIGRCLGVAGLK
ncbi:DUF7522 family protein [Halorussus caseinilyticus]|uniref:Roadblock/LC7 domain-containing protein n=1 Tax=Halorussus caseinilyticus TaxID=3034025 RepID=A0ABD5WH24_9EURY|nr:hypothetical protein [Halorussus sp. DT72]